MSELNFTNDSLRKYKVAETYIKLDIIYSDVNNAKLYEILSLAVQKQLIDFRYNKEIIYEIEFEKGSTKARIAFFAALNTLIFYGELRESLATAYNDVKWLSERVIESAKQEDNFIDDNILRTEKRTGLTGRLKRTLDRINYLQNNINNLGNNQIQVELNKLYQDLSNIIHLLELAERATFLNALPNEVRNNLPQPNEDINHLYNLYALKPEDEE
jgi:hypothetical protein